MKEENGEYRWISVEDRLPDPCKLVWYMTKIKSVFVCAHVKEGQNWYWAASNPDFYISEGRIESNLEYGVTSDATHWHPVPDLPKIEK